MTGQYRLRSTELEWREIEGEIVALDSRTSKYLAGNRTAAALWPLLQAGATRAELIERMLDRFDVEEAQASADLERFLTGLSERGLLEP